jgi:cytochrome c
MRKSPSSGRRQCTSVLTLLVACMLSGAASPLARAEGPPRPALGRPIADEEVARWDLSVYPDGRGLPEGRGNVAAGRAVYEQNCLVCHGERGTGGAGGHLVGRGPLTGPDADKTIGSYWPYATTLFDFIRRSMPMNAPGSLSANEIYAVTAYLLYENQVIAADAVMDRRTLPRVRMPNRDGFVGIDAALPEAYR